MSNPSDEIVDVFIVLVRYQHSVGDYKEARRLISRMAVLSYTRAEDLRDELFPWDEGQRL